MSREQYFSSVDDRINTSPDNSEILPAEPYPTMSSLGFGEYRGHQNPSIGNRKENGYWLRLYASVKRLIPPYKLALPCDSNGIPITKSPARMNRAPLVYTGAEVSRFANIAMMGYIRPLAFKTCAFLRSWGILTDIQPKMRFAVAVRAFPVPRSFVGKISGV